MGRILSLIAWASGVGCTAQPMAAPSPEIVEVGPVGAIEVRLGPSAYEEARSRLDHRIDWLEAQVEEKPGSWITAEQLANAHVARAQLTGDYQDWLAAEAAMAAAFERAAEGAGPFASRAGLHYALHRMAQASDDVERAAGRLLLDQPARASIEALRGDVAFHTGRYDEARDRYHASELLRPTVGSAFRLAHHAWKTGDATAAARWLDEAERRVVGDAPQLEAWLSLQRGLLALDRGRYREALAHYDVADAAFDGWWLVDEHRAEVLALLGRTEEALQLYRSVVARTGAPELLDALAGVLEDVGSDEAGTMSARAREGWEVRLAVLPEAHYGHAFAHFLGAGDAARALGLAEANHALRPDAEADLWLAQAHLQLRSLDAARIAVERALATPYRTAELHVTAALVYAALGEEAAADAQWAAAARMHSHPEDLVP